MSNNRSIIVREAERRLIVRDQSRTTILRGQDNVRILEVARQGPSGSSYTSRIEVPFSFGDATPANMFVAKAGKLIEKITVFINTIFNGLNPSLSIGDIGAPTLLMDTFENNPTEEAAYQVTPNLNYESDTPIMLFITPGLGASQGSGLVVVEVQN